MNLFNKAKKPQTEFANIISWLPKWDTGAPMPHVFCNGTKTFLMYVIDTADTNLDGSSVTLTDNTSDVVYSFAVTEFTGDTFRFGMANDEVFSGFPLSKKGLKPCSAHYIQNSLWIEELKQIHSVHPYYNEKLWENKKHYMLLFKDQIFEVITTTFKTEIFNSTFNELILKISKRMI